MHILRRMVEKMVRLIAQHTLAAFLVAIIIAGSASYIAAPRLWGQSYTVSIVAKLPTVPGAGKLYGFAEIIATAPGAKPIAKIVEIKPGQGEIKAQINTYELVKSSKKNIASAKNPAMLKIFKEEASAITVLLMLYDDKGNHYLGSAIVGSYDIALAKYKNPLKAVEKDPYLVLHAGTIIIPAKRFALVNVTQLYANIVEKYYQEPLLKNKTTQRTRAAATGTRLPSGCEVVTIKNYKQYGLQLTDSDFITIPDLYNAQPPSSYMQHLQGGLSDTEKKLMYREFAEKFSTRVYIPSTCPLDSAIYNALREWYDPLWDQEPRLAGLLTLQAFWTKIAKNIGIYFEPNHYPTWQDASIYLKSIEDAPLLRLAGVCQSGCTSNNLQFQLAISANEGRYYKNGLSIANTIFIGEERKAVTSGLGLTDLSLHYLDQGYVGFIITKNLYIYSSGDGVFIDYYVTKKNVPDYQGVSHEYWVVEPIVAFTPLQGVSVDWDSLRGIRVKTGSSEYQAYMDKYYELVGATRSNYVWKSFHLQPSDSILEVIDTNKVYSYRTSIAGAVIGVLQMPLKWVISAVVGEEGGLASTLAAISGNLISYAYTNYGETAIIVKLKVSSLEPYGGGDFDLVKMTPHLGYPSENLYFTSNEEQYSWYPIFITYFIVYRG
jgi:hypothetical protein